MTSPKTFELNIQPDSPEVSEGLKAMVDGAKENPLGFEFRREFERFIVTIRNGKDDAISFDINLDALPDRKGFMEMVTAAKYTALSCHLAYYAFSGVTSFRLLVDEEPKARVFLSGSMAAKAGTPES